jgi:hypothetical protein
MFPRSSRVALGIALSSVLLAPALPLAGASAAPVAAADRDDVPQLVTVHEEGLPPGISADDPTDTKSLLKKSGVEDQSETENDTPNKSLGRAASTYFPAGPSVIPSFPSHVPPACVGDGTDGRRVRVLYVRENSDTSRLAALRTSFLNELAQVDDLFAYASAAPGESRRVRWYSDSNCQPIITEVVLPNGSLSTTHAELESRLRTAGYSNGLHKYLVFAEGNRLGGTTCGLGDYYDASSPGADNPNNGGAALDPAVARVDAICWFSNSNQAITTHELIHTLGGVLSGAPNATPRGHCDDARDPMCYDDGSGMPMRSVCTQTGAALQLDCNKDDYFSIAPAAGSYLANHWNTANSMFLTKVTTAPQPPAAPTNLTMKARSVTTMTPQWTRPPGATKFLIYYGTSSDVSTMKTKTVGDVSYDKLTGLRSNTRYYVRVRAYSASGLISGYSSLASMVTIKDVPPSKPGKPQLTYRSTSALKFTWTKSARAVRYKLYYGTKSSGSGAKYKNVTGTSYTLTGLSRRKKYYVSVYAFSEGGLVSVRSTRVSGTTR